MNEQSAGKAVGARTGEDPYLAHGVGRRDVVFVFSREALADAQRRGFCFTSDQALLALSYAEDRVGRIIAANPWRSILVAALRYVKPRPGDDVTVNRVTLVRPLRLPRHDPTKVSALLHSYQRYDRILGRHVRKLGLDRPAVLTFNPFVAAFCPLSWASNVTYYAMDDWASHPAFAPWWPIYPEAYRGLRKRGARIICVSDELAARVAADAPVVVIPNGIDETHWSKPWPPPSAVSGLTHPIVTYVGSIDSRLDTGLVARMADDVALRSLALIGPIIDSAVAEKLRSIPKVVLCGPMSRAEVAGALMYSDVCVIPHVIDSLTRAMSPLKLYEYLAAGKPVATTDLPAVHGVSERVIISSADGFPAAVRTALELPHLDEDERLEFVRSNSWTSRHGRMLRVMLAEDPDWWEA